MLFVIVCFLKPTVALQHRHHRAGSAEMMRPALGEPSIRVVSASAAEPRNPFSDARCPLLALHPGLLLTCLLCTAPASSIHFVGWSKHHNLL